MVIGPSRDPHLYGSQPSLLEAALSVPEWVADSYPTEVSILQRYESEMQLEGFAQHAIDTVHVFRDFAEKTMNADLFPVVLLAGVAEAALSDDPTKNAPATRALKHYKSYVGSDTLWDYYTTIWADLPVTEDFSKQTRLNLPASGERELLLKTTEDVEVRTLAWDDVTVPTPTDKAINFINGVQVEAPVIKAVQAFVELKKQQGTDRKLYQQCFDVESVYAPYSEQLGLKNLASGLRNEVNLIKQTKLNREAQLKEAHAIVTQIGDRNAYKRLAHEVIELATGLQGIGEFTLPDRCGHGVVSGESKLYVEGQNQKIDEVSVQWRRKGEADIAKKMTARLPKDVAGIRFIVPTREDLAEMFAFVCQNLEKYPGLIIPAPSESRTQAFHIRGHEHKLVKKVAAALAIAGYSQQEQADKFEVKVNHPESEESNYEVVKATFFYKFINDRGETVYVPTELQIQTEKAELKSKTGKQGHGMFQALKDHLHNGKKGIQSGVLVKGSHMRAIYRRGTDMRTVGLNMDAKQSIVRGAEFRKKINRSNGRNVARIALGR